MSPSEASSTTGPIDSPDPASHAANVYDQTDADEWVDEEDDDDMDFEPTTEGSDDAEFFESAEDPEADFQGQQTLVNYCSGGPL